MAGAVLSAFSYGRYVEFVQAMATRMAQGPPCSPVPFTPLVQRALHRVESTALKDPQAQRRVRKMPGRKAVRLFPDMAGVRLALFGGLVQRRAPRDGRGGRSSLEPPSLGSAFLVPVWAPPCVCSALLLACRQVIAAVDAVLSGGARNAMCIIRPPGHHAGRRGLIPASADHGGESSGFCIFNHVMVGATHALHRPQPVARVAVSAHRAQTPAHPTCVSIVRALGAR